MPRHVIESLLRKTAGLDATAVSAATLDHAVRRRMAVHGLTDRERYSERLRSSEAELQELIETLVVPESWFFRHPEAFTALARLVIEDWLPAHPMGVLRLLSAPCAGGEEPYSIAMALLDRGLPGHRFQVDAVDISRRALTRARRAVYGPYSFRCPDLSFRERHFRYARNEYHLAEPIRAQVRFQHGNLIVPDFAPSAAPYDFIFCRNVLIYFDRPAQERVIQTLCRLVTPAGVLFVGPAEAPLAMSGGLEPVSPPGAHAMGGASAYRKSASDRGERPGRPRLGSGTDGTGLDRHLQLHRSSVSTLAPSPRPWVSGEADPLRLEPAAVTTPEPPLPPSADLETAGRLADAGQWTAAAALCEASLRERGASTGAYYLLALVHDAQGNLQQAVDCYRKVLYLEPEHPEALMHLALLAQKQGDAAGARRLQARARRVATPKP
jgi:chemotaxis protein methyltransferase WspC